MHPHKTNSIFVEKIMTKQGVCECLYNLKGRFLGFEKELCVSLSAVAAADFQNIALD